MFIERAKSGAAQKKIGLRPLFILIPLLFSTPVGAQEVALPKAPYLDIETIKRWQGAETNVTFIDVREKEEYDAGHLDGAINIPYQETERRMDELEFDHPNVFYCIHSSWRAPYVANLLKDLGKENVYILEGGIAAWNAGGQIIYATDTSQAGVVAPYPKSLEKILKHPPDQDHDGNLLMSLEELKNFDGKNGRPAFVAIDGIIYDLTNSRLWRGGEHDPSHGAAYAGRDLTGIMNYESPHGDKYLKYFPVVGKVK